MRIKLLLAGIVVIGMMASCANDGAVQTKNAEPATIIIALKGNFEKTKAAADLNSDATINNLVVGLFDAGGNLVSLSTPTATAAGSGVTATVSGTTLVTQVAVAANVDYTKFSSVKKLDDFHNVLVDISNTTTKDGGKTPDGTKQYESNLPMEGENTSINATSGSCSPEVDVTRLVSKVELNSITVDFDNNGAYAHYKFVPTEIFMSNVAETSLANSSNPYVPTQKSYLQGETGTTGALAYLSTGSINSTIIADPTQAKISYADVYTFFPMANDGTIGGKKTKLIIKGNLYDASNTQVGTPFYYPVIINQDLSGNAINGTTAGQIAPNSYYQLNVTIKSKGVTDPTQELTAAQVNLTIKVTPWPTTPTTQNVVFN